MDPGRTKGALPGNVPSGSRVERNDAYPPSLSGRVSAEAPRTPRAHPAGAFFSLWAPEPSANVYALRDKASKQEEMLTTLLVLAQAVSLQGADGKEYRPLELYDAKAAVFLFVTTECPIANKMAPEMNRIARSFASRDFRFYFVNVEPGIAAATARSHAKEFGFTAPVLLDRRHELARRLGVTRTPEAAVMSPYGEVLYRGRINDQFVDLGRRQAQVRHHDLRDALEAVLAGKRVPRPRTQAVGCTLPPLE